MKHEDNLRMYLGQQTQIEDDLQRMRGINKENGDHAAELQAQLAEYKQLISDGADLHYNQERKIEGLQAQVKDAFRAGYTQGHNDTVEAVYCLDDELKADEYIAEQALEDKK